MRAAGDDTPSLPEDAAALRMLLLETLARCDTLGTELGSITAERDLPWHAAPAHAAERQA